MSYILKHLEEKNYCAQRPLALIVAGTSTIGQSLISSLINDGYFVVFTWHTNEAAANLIIESNYNYACSIQLNLTNKDEVLLFCGAIENIKFDVTIYCAGKNPAVLCDALDIEEINSTVLMNYVSPMLIINQIGKTMKQYKDNETKILYVSSVAVEKISIGNSIYGSTKLAMERYLASVALEMARFNIRILCLRPGYIKTKMLEDFCQQTGNTLHGIEKTIPMRKMLSSNDFVNAALAFIKGQIVTTGVTLTIGNGEGI